MTTLTCWRSCWDSTGCHFFREGQTYDAAEVPADLLVYFNNAPVVTDPVYRGGSVLTALPDSAINSIR
ncbi:hypothetical protein CCC_02281 [Paramagnetospirillum magnetotacticum MS-1]|uniref:Uncharacterized protein n=1 Tax=Paramagnetospirillum magnetotacticum MS-1 TaxID=272627 RepID=A0A0C2V179_PARME|nr:hypothetical protein [Paramagnetospirillum magnetotacticum]KIL98831.1 hypothetical protein CCC_02281 [Paramagnetospirillum magnetotacticum MS-1]